MRGKCFLWVLFFLFFSVNSFAGFGSIDGDIKKIQASVGSEKNKILDGFPSTPSLPGTIKSIFKNDNVSTLATRFFHVQYARACDLNAILIKKKEAVLSAVGRSQCDGRSNTLWVRDTPSALLRIQSLMAHLDVPVAQLVIKVRIVNMSNQSMRKLGIHFVSAPADGGINEGGFKLSFPRGDTSTGAITLPLARLGDDMLLDMQLDALQHLGQAKIVASPELLTESGKTASIEAGEEIPYQQQVEGGGTSVAFKKAVLRLLVTPVVLPKNKISLHLVINQDQVSSLKVDGVPAIRTQQLKTQALVNSGQTVVLGGVYETADSQERDEIAGLAHIPLLGLLFRHHEHKHERKQLLLFVTPRIISRK